MESLAQIMQMVIYLILLIGLGLNLYVIRAIGKGVLNIVFISFGFCIFFVGLSQIFVYLKDIEVYKLEEVTLHVWWHILVYFAMLSVIWGGYRIKGIVDTNSTEGFSGKDLTIFSIMVVLGLSIFAIAPSLEASLAPMIIGSFVDTFGLHHFGAFALAGIAGWYMFYIKGHWGALGVSILAIVVFGALLSTQHFWELLTESWKVVTLESETIELVEQFIVLPALILYAYAQWNLVKFIKG